MTQPETELVQLPERPILAPTWDREKRSVQELIAAGKSLRQKVKRSRHAELDLPDRDPVAILEEQHKTRIPELVPVRVGRMLESPFAYYRGAAANMAFDLSKGPFTGVKVVMSGDAHLANFGMYAAPDRRVVFDLNDFDEAAYGPWEWDLKRLLTSIVIAGRDREFPPDTIDEAVRAGARRYREVMAELINLPILDRYYHRVEVESLFDIASDDSQKALRKAVRKARNRTSDQALEKIATSHASGRPVIVEQPPIVRHLGEFAGDRIKELKGIWDAYLTTVRADQHLLLNQFELADVAMRVVGVGSVGTACFIALLIGPGSEPLFLQVKEAQRSVIYQYGDIRLPHHDTAPFLDGGYGEGHRVVSGQRILQASSDPFLGWVEYEGRSFYWRQFRDMKGSANISDMNGNVFIEYARLCGRILARAHSQSPSAALIWGYMGRGTKFDDAVVNWSYAYADQVERDYEALQRAVASGRLPAERGV